MMLRFRVLVLTVGLVTGLVAAGCGGSASVSPVAPSGAGASSGAVISGQVTGTTAAAPAGSNSTFSTMGTSAGVKVSVAGTNIQSMADDQGHFVLNGVPGGTVTLEFTGPGSSATVTLAGITPSDQIDITVTLRGNSAHVDSEHRRTDNHRVEVNGRIASIDVAARTFVVDGTTVNVPVTTTIHHGNQTIAFTALAVGDHVEVKGTTEASVVTASEVKVEQGGQDAEGNDTEDDGAEDSGAGGAKQAVLNGAVSGLTGTCPTLSFTVQATTVTTTASTSFKDITCAAVANGTAVQVKGTKQTDGSVVASKVEKK